MSIMEMFGLHGRDAAAEQRVVAGRDVGVPHVGDESCVAEVETTFRVYHAGRLFTEALRTATKPIARVSPDHDCDARRELT